MSQPRVLSLTGGWENIVNDVERHNARIRLDEKRYQRNLKKKLRRVTDLALIAILSVVLGATGILDPWFAGGAAVLLVCAACFLGGQIWEGTIKKCKRNLYLPTKS